MYKVSLKVRYPNYEDDEESSFRTNLRILWISLIGQIPNSKTELGFLIIIIYRKLQSGYGGKKY